MQLPFRGENDLGGAPWIEVRNSLPCLEALQFAAAASPASFATCASAPG